MRGLEWPTAEPDITQANVVSVDEDDVGFGRGGTFRRRGLGGECCQQAAQV